MLATRGGKPARKETQASARAGSERAGPQQEAASAARAEQIDRFTAPLLGVLASLGLRREQLAVVAGAAMAKQLKPLPLVGLAILAGFLVGRLWKGLGALASNDLLATVLGLVGVSQAAKADAREDQLA